MAAKYNHPVVVEKLVKFRASINCVEKVHKYVCTCLDTIVAVENLIVKIFEML